MATLKQFKSEVKELDLEKNYQEACQDIEFANLVRTLPIEAKEAMKKTSQLENVLEEKSNCKNCKGLYMCKNAYAGHAIVPIVKENTIYFTYTPCTYQKQVVEKESEQNKKVRMKDIDYKLDKKQMPIIKWLDTFYQEYDRTKPMKGLYLHGSFGSGKTYLVSALLNELNMTKNVSIQISYFPDLLRNLKDFDDFSYNMNQLLTVDILLLDDIGAEKVTEWGRDEILGSILQERMEHHKTTFFTSNLTLKELEEHLSISSSGVDKVKARRIIERIKQLSEDIELVAENKRG